MSTEILYRREGDQVRIRLRALTNHELREVLVGLWSRLGRADQVDHIHELSHYLEPGSRLSPLAAAIRDAEQRRGTIDVQKLLDEEMHE